MEPYYQDDLVTLYHGDCRKITTWLDADVLVTDPPYGMDLRLEFRFTNCGVCGVASRSRYGTCRDHRDQATSDRRRQIHGDQSTDLRDDILTAWGSEKSALVFGTWRLPRPDATRTVVVWDKGDSPGMGALDLPWGLSHEEIYVLGKWPAAPNGGRRREGGTPRRDPSVIRAITLNSQAKERPDHPTPKPLGLMERLILKTNGVVADPFAGSGTTIVAAKQLGRKAIGVELDERYCEIAARRLAQDTLFGESA